MVCFGKFSFLEIFVGEKIIYFFFKFLKEFSCQEVRESSDDLVVFFATSAEQERFMSMMEAIWQSKYVSFFFFFIR